MKTRPTTRRIAHVAGVMIACSLLMAGAVAVLAGEHADARFRGTGRADPIRIANVRRVDGPAAGQSWVQFDLAWDHSWRAAWKVPKAQHGAAGTLDLENWDAAWVFVKFRRPGAEAYSHAALSIHVGDYRAPAGAALKVGLSDDGKRGMGVFIYRSAAGSGANDWKGVQLRWLHDADGVDVPEDIDIKVFGLKMVYVPRCAFCAGDGWTTETEGQAAQFPAGASSPGWPGLPLTGVWETPAARFSAGATTRPFRIESEGALTLGGESTQNLGNHDGLGIQRSADDFTSEVAQTLPAQFPKGYAAFYCMRHEITQGQYVEFLNTLSFAQQARLSGGNANAEAGSPLMKSASRFRNGIKLAVPGTANSVEKVARRDAVLASVGVARPAVYETDTPHLPHGGGYHHGIYVTGRGGCNGVYYAAWAGLRPMTELEYEKACRGPLEPVPGEYAWGTDRIAGTSSPEPPYDGYALHNAGKPDEHVTWEGANGPDALHGNAAWGATIMQSGEKHLWGTSYAVNPIHGPLRAGIFATRDSGRVAAGASYWGILDLSGNVWEEIVSLGNLSFPWQGMQKRKAGRRFAGTHGDGTLAQPPGWDALAQRGGAFDSPPRSVSNRVGYGRGTSGFRCVRSAQGEAAER